MAPPSTFRRCFNGDKKRVQYIIKMTVSPTAMQDGATLVFNGVEFV